MNKLKDYIGDKQYYIKLFKITIPLAMSMLLQSCMEIVDSIMVSSIGMVTAVGNALNVLLLHDGICYGIVSGISVFAAQFYGADQKDNMARTYGLGLLFMLINSSFWIIMVYLFGSQLLSFYLDDTYLLKYSLSYIKIVCIALVPQAFCFTTGSMLRSMHNTKTPFIISTIGAIANVIFNYLFINILKVGIVGAAYGTLLSSLINTIIYIYLLIFKKPIFFIPNKMFNLSVSFVKPIVKTVMPIIVNETFFGFGNSLFNKAYGLLGTQAMDAYYVAVEIWNLFSFAIWGFGSGASILIGTTLGKGDIDLAIKESKYQLGCGFILGLVLSLGMVAFANPMLSLFSISSELTYINARNVVYVMALKVFIRCFTYMMFSTLKAGGDAKIINLYDSGFMYLIGLPLAYICAFAGIKNIALLLLIVQLEQVIRLFFTGKRYLSNVWAKDLTKLV